MTRFLTAPLLLLLSLCFRPAAAAGQQPGPPPERLIDVCVASADGLAEVRGIYRPAVGDTLALVAGERRPFAAVYPPGPPNYVASERWFVGRAPLTMGQTRYRYVAGGERVVEPDSLRRIAAVRGFPVFVIGNDPSPPPFLYLPVRPGCVFHAYQR